MAARIFSAPNPFLTTKRRFRPTRASLASLVKQDFINDGLVTYPPFSGFFACPGYYLGMQPAIDTLHYDIALGLTDASRTVRASMRVSAGMLVDGVREMWLGFSGGRKGVVKGSWLIEAASGLRDFPLRQMHLCAYNRPKRELDFMPGGS
jgi:hypothetical protein